METLATASISSLGLFVGLAVWIILFAVVLDVLKKHSPFDGWAVYVIAVCVALLSVVGIFQFLAPADNAAAPKLQDSPFLFLLLPYAAMGISILIVLLLLLFTKTWCRNDERSSLDRSPTAQDIRDDGRSGSVRNRAPSDKDRWITGPDVYAAKKPISRMLACTGRSFSYVAFYPDGPTASGNVESLIGSASALRIRAR